MNMVSSSCSPLRSSKQLQFQPNCAASIPRRHWARVGVKVPAGKRWFARFESLPQLPAGEVEEHILQAAPSDPHVGGSTSICAHHAVTVASTCGSTGLRPGIRPESPRWPCSLGRAELSRERSSRGGRGEPQWSFVPLRISSAGCRGHRHPWSMMTSRSARFLGLLELVGGQQHRHAIAAQRVDQLPHQQPGMGSMPAWVVEEDQFGTADQRAGQRKPLLCRR